MKEIYENLFYQYLKNNKEKIEKEIEGKDDKHIIYLKIKIKELKKEIETLKEEIKRNKENLTEFKNYRKRHEERKWKKY